MRKALLIGLAIALAGTAVLAVQYAPGDIHREKGCSDLDGDTVCIALMHNAARQDALIYYRETNGVFGFQVGADEMLKWYRKGPCAWPK